MNIKYSISLWNFTHYMWRPPLEEVLERIQQRGYGVELWRHWSEERDLFEDRERGKLAHITREMRVSVHSCGPKNREEHRSQVDAARDLGAEVIVLHPADLSPEGKGSPDISLARDAVAYAGEHDVRMALENGPLPFLTEAVQAVPNLEICLDVGHVYFEEESMGQFLDSLKSRLTHLHLQDILPGEDRELPYTLRDRYVPGRGGIPQGDWELFVETLDAIDFDGWGVFEIRPQSPWQTARGGKEFLERLRNGGK